MGSAATYALNLAAQIASIAIQVDYARKVAHSEMDVYQQRTDQTNKLAGQVQDRADEKHQLWVDAYKQCEIEYIREVCADDTPPIDYGSVRQHLELAYRPAFSRNVGLARECLDDSCAPPSCAATRSLSVHQAAAMAWGLEGAMRAGEDEHRLQLAQANERKQWVVNSGNGFFGNQTGGSLAAAGIYARLASNAGEAANGAYALLGAQLRRITTAMQPEPQRRYFTVPRPSVSPSRPTTLPTTTGSRPDLFDADLIRPTQMTPPMVQPEGPDPYDVRFGRHIMTDYEDVPEDPNAPLGGRNGRGRDMPWFPEK